MTENNQNTDMNTDLNSEDGAEITTASFEKSTLEINLGVQPLDKFMEELSLLNHDLVAAYQIGAEAQLSHKVVKKARTGRRISPKLQAKIVEAFNFAAITKIEEYRPVKKEDLFNY